MYSYFCGCCGHRFEHELPERDGHGILNEIACPECGARDVYPDTPAGAAASARDQMEYEAEQAADEKEDD